MQFSYMFLDVFFFFGNLSSTLSSGRSLAGQAANIENLLASPVMDHNMLRLGLSLGQLLMLFDIKQLVHSVSYHGSIMCFQFIRLVWI